MSGFTNTFLYEFVTLLVVLDPVATIPIYLAVTRGLDRKRALLVAFYALGVSFLILLFFIVAGQHLLEALKITMPQFQLAGSLILLLFALKLVLGQVVAEAEAMPAGATALERAVYPLAIPGIAGTGSMLTVVLLTDNHSRTILEQASTTGVLLLCLAIFFGVFAGAGAIFRLLGPPGIQIISRVFGLVLASLAVKNLITAIKLSFNLA